MRGRAGETPACCPHVVASGVGLLTAIFHEGECPLLLLSAGDHVEGLRRRAERDSVAAASRHSCEHDMQPPPTPVPFCNHTDFCMWGEDWSEGPADLGQLRGFACVLWELQVSVGGPLSIACLNGTLLPRLTLWLSRLASSPGPCTREAVCFVK